MAATLLDGNVLLETVKDDLRVRIGRLAELGITPGLGTILVGDDPPSHAYVRLKHDDSAEIGVRSVHTELPATVTQQQLHAVIDRYNHDPDVDAYILQVPLPEHLDAEAALLAIDPAKDADGLHPVNLGKLVMGVAGAPRPCTPLGIQALLMMYKVPIEGQHVVIIGRGLTIGRPLANLLSLKETNANAIHTIERNSIFTNCAKTDDGDIWWEGMTKEAPAHLIDWHGNDWTPESGTPSAHPNARFTTPAAQDPAIAPEWEDPAGVPIDAIMFGGRRANIVPLVREAFDWTHGVFMGSIMSSETTAAAVGEVGKLRFDPFAMLPFCGYNMADYWAHWLEVGAATRPELLPRIYYVNWFRRDTGGRFLWPGFGENSRVLEWIFRRGDGEARATETPIGFLPEPDDLNTAGLEMAPEDLAELLRVDGPAIVAELPQFEQHYARFGDRLPAALRTELDRLRERLLA